MNALSPYAGDDNSIVGFKWKGLIYGPESPCLIMDDVYCTANDWLLWKGHTLEWIGKVKAVDPAAYRTLVDRYAVLLVRNDGTTKTRVSAVRAMVSLAQFARMVIVEKHGQTVTDIKNDWGDVGSIGWPIAEDVIFEISKAIENTKKKIEDHMKQRWTLYLVGGGLVLWFYLMGGRR
jgi:hypothetical protein